MIRNCTNEDFMEILKIINDGASAYKGVIREDCCSDPYMSETALQHEIECGVKFWGWEENIQLLGIMGIQDVKDVTLIRHAYVRTSHRNKGIGEKLLYHLKNLTKRPILIGTWKAATWAIRFYEKRGFQLAAEDQKDRLLEEYWSISKRQAETSVVLHERVR